ncbi:MAG TPA: hypothetical protein VJU77_08970 [Chthoniobacterales bacterium]|nr:hypothetical protein [Chthoniobacterales bacterium]
MTKLIHSTSLLLAAFLFLWPATASAQQPQTPLAAGPTTSPPPDPASLPAPPPLEWTSLNPKDSDEGSNGEEIIDVPPPKSDVPIAPPPPPVVENPLSVGPDPEEMELVKPDVEVWREDSEFPQIPPRQFEQLEQAYVTGTEPVVLRVQFHPLAAGKRVFVKLGAGITLNPSVKIMTVSAAGDCLVSAQLIDGFSQSNIIFYCEGVKTILPVVRGSLAQVEAKEEESRP